MFAGVHARAKHPFSGRELIGDLLFARAFTAYVQEVTDLLMLKTRWRHLRQRCQRIYSHSNRDERGQYLVQTVILLPMMMILVGLVLDGGWMYWQYRRAEITVNAAAQAASHAIDVDYFRETNQIRLEQGEAWSAASGFVNINQRGQMYVTGIYISNNQVILNANAEVQTIFFRLAGISSLSMRVEGRAYPAFGINTEGQ